MPDSSTPSRKNLAVPARHSRPCSPTTASRRATSSSLIAGSWCIGTTIRSVRSPRASSARTSSSSSGVPTITCAPVSPTRLSARSVRRVRVEALGLGPLRHDGVDEVHRGVLQQRARRAAVGVDDDLRRLAEHARPFDPRQRQRRVRGQRRVPVEEVDHRRAVADGLRDRVRAQPGGVERLVARAVREHPAARAVGREPRAHLLDARRRAQVDPARHARAPERVDVAVGQAGDDRQAAAVEHPRARPDARTHLRVVPDRHQHAVAPGERGRRRTLVVERPDRGAEDGPVGVHRAEDYRRALRISSSSWALRGK